MDKTLQKLIDIELIKQNQVTDFEELLTKSEPKSKSFYLTLLFQYEFKKLTGLNYSQVGIRMRFEDEKPKPAEQTKINEALIQYLSKLKSCDLISENQLTHFQSGVHHNDFVHLLQLLLTVMEQVALKERMHPKKLTLFADKLKSKAIVNSTYDSLIVAIQQEKLQHPIAFLNYCDKAVIISEQDYPNEPEKYLELIHKKTASVLPELDFENFEFQVVPDSSIADNDHKFYDFVVSLKSNGKKYKQKSSCHLYNPGKNQYNGNKIDQLEYYKIFNKILIDLQSPYRLHEVKAYQGNAVDWNIFGIMALTKEQANLLHGGDAYFTPSNESFKNNLTSKKIEQAINEYKNIGLLSHLTGEQIEKAQEKVAEQENTNLIDVLMAFPNVVYVFDAELDNLEDPYAELIREFKKISHDDFNATEISDNFDVAKEKKVELNFKIGNTLYTNTLNIENDWIDPDFLSYVKSVVTEQNLKGQFYELYADDPSLIYLTKEQFDYLRANKLLIFADECQTEEE